MQDRRLGIRQASRAPDNGYVWHALLTAAFGDNAPRPFVDRIALRSNLVLGYTAMAPDQLPTNREMDELARAALRVNSIEKTVMPGSWRAGQSLSFEVRCRPIVRTRRHARSGNIDEMDAAVHASIENPRAGREQAYSEWLERELGREGACKLEQARMVSFRRTCVLRRSQGGDRKPQLIEGPEVWMAGRLVVEQPIRFQSLLRRGLGRHRAFGFGCLLVARPGVLD